MAEFFAGVNTEKGFLGFPDGYFNTLSRLYIIKGTAGSGKSTLMKRIADQCEKMGFTVHRVRCSSDPESLDGVILPQKNTGIADGTAPHVLDTSIPLAKEILVDTGRYIDEKSLDKDGIIYHSGRKKQCYLRGYAYIACAVEASRAASSIAEEALETEKLYSFALRFYKKHIACSEKGVTRKRISAAFTGKGIVVANSFPDAEKVFTLRGGRGTEYIFPQMLYEMGKADGEEMYISPDATDSRLMNGIYFSARRVYVTTLPDERGTDINMTRFFLPEKYMHIKPELKEGRELAKNAYEMAQKQLLQAAYHHRELEKRYVNAMDFAPLDKEFDRILAGMTE